MRLDCPQRFFFGMAGIAFAALATAAGPAGMREYFARYDRNGDGRVSLVEYQDYLTRGFARLDRDGNGLVERGEWDQPGRPALSLSRHREHLAAGFHRQDRNRDGFLDLAELTAPPR